MTDEHMFLWTRANRVTAVHLPVVQTSTISRRSAVKPGTTVHLKKPSHTCTFTCRTDEQVVCCRLSSIQSSLYKSLVNSKSTLSALAKAGSGKVAASSLSSIMHLKKLCNRMSPFIDRQMLALVQSCRLFCC